MLGYGQVVNRRTNILKAPVGRVEPHCGREKMPVLLVGRWRDPERSNRPPKQAPDVTGDRAIAVGARR